MDKEDLIGMIGMACLMGYMWVIDKFFPPGHPYRDPLGLLGMGLIFAYYGGFEVAVRLTVQKYPFIRVIVRPENRVFYLYIAKSDKLRGEVSIQSQQIDENLYATLVNLAFPIEFFEFGKVRKISIVHTRSWRDRILFTPGRAVFWGYGVPHPHTCTIVCYRIGESPFDVEYGEPVPMLYLREAPGDYKPIARAMVSMIGGEEVVEVEEPVEEEAEGSRIVGEVSASILIENLKNRIRELTIALAEKERRASYWHRRAVQSEELLTQLRSEMEGYKKAKGEVPLLAREMFLRYLHIYGSVEKAFKALSQPAAKSILFSKWITLPLLIVCGFGYLYIHPEIVDRFLDWLVLPQNQIVFIIALGIICIAIYKLLKKR